MPLVTFVFPLLSLYYALKLCYLLPGICIFMAQYLVEYIICSIVDIMGCLLLRIGMHRLS